MLDTPWKIWALVGTLVAFRIVMGLWRSAPNRPFLLELSNSALIAFALVFLLIRPFLLQAFFIPSGSMEPTLHMPDSLTNRLGDRILVNRFIYRLGPPRRGDIVVFTAPKHALESVALGGTHQEQGTDWIKRVIGLPGDRIQVVSDVGVKVNGRLIEEPYAMEKPLYNFPVGPDGAASAEPYTVPAESLFVMGDNRNESADSHWWRDMKTGQPRPDLPIRNVLGRSMIVFWPLNRLAHLTQ
jgi:signal peptidase I